MFPQAGLPGAACSWRNQCIAQPRLALPGAACLQAVFIATDSCGSPTIINILLTLLGWIPGGPDPHAVHAVPPLCCAMLCATSAGHLPPLAAASKPACGTAHCPLLHAPGASAGIIHAIWVLLKT